MSLAESLFLSSGMKVIGLAGGKGRNYFANQIATDFARSGKKVVIAQFGRKTLPLAGQIISAENGNRLLREVEAALEKEPVVYAAQGLSDNIATGVEIATLQKMSQIKLIDQILLIVGPAEEYSVLTKKSISDVLKVKLVDQLIYFFQIDKIDQPFDENCIENIPVIKKVMSQKRKSDRFNHQFIISYLTQPESGALKIFRQRYPALLLLTDVNSILLENKALNLARNLFAKNIENIFLANLKENFVKKVPH